MHNFSGLGRQFCTLPPIAAWLAGTGAGAQPATHLGPGTGTRPTPLQERPRAGKNLHAPYTPQTAAASYHAHARAAAQDQLHWLWRPIQLNPPLAQR